MFYEQVKSLCDGRNVKITTLARKLSLSPSAPDNWKNGSLPKAETIMKIADYFGVTTDYLLYGDDRQNNSVGYARDSAVVQGSSGTISVTSGSQLETHETELIRIFRSLDLRGQNAVITCLYEQADRVNKQ